MFLGGWFLVRHVSIKVLWWLAFAIESSIPFSFVPSSCRGSVCSVSAGVPCLMVGGGGGFGLFLSFHLLLC